MVLTDANGDAVGPAITVTTDGSGSFPAGTTYPVPAGVSPGDYVLLASDADGNSAQDTVTVTVPTEYDPTLVADDPVQAGTDLPVSSDGWPPNTEVTVVLTDANGDPVGPAIVVTTDGSGSFPAGTTYPVPAGVSPGGYVLLASDADGNTAQDAVTVTAAATDPGTDPGTDTDGGSDTDGRGSDTDGGGGGKLPRTGADSGAAALPIGVLILAAGLGFIAWSRREGSLDHE